MTELLSQVAAIIWWPVLFLIIGGGLFFLFYSRFVQYKYFRHAIEILMGKHEDPNAPGQISPYKALSTALASTVGMGNLGGVAAAIALGGPGAMFWMWVTAIIGMSTNFFTSALATMYRGRDSEGEIQGGPMYIITEALGNKYRFAAVFFCICCMIGCLPIFQANQLTQVILDIGLRPLGVTEKFMSVGAYNLSATKIAIGVVITVLCSLVIVGGIQRIGSWAGKLVPVMIILHFLAVAYILVVYADQIPSSIALIFNDAFQVSHYHGDPFLGGMVGGLIMLGVRRATFSNEAGIGTAPMAMGASKSTQPVHEGLISMLSPVIDTIISCTLTALAILVTGAWTATNESGITLTSMAFTAALPQGGNYVLLLCASVFAVSALFSYSYYGRKAFAYIVGQRKSVWYDYIYLSTIVLGAIASMDLVLNIIDMAFALMAVPTMITGMILAPRVMAHANQYFKKLEKPHK